MSNIVIGLIEEITGKSREVSVDSPLIGDQSVLDSLDLVDLCLRLEDVARENGFEFDWTSESAMSRTNSIFRSAGTLQQYFDSQKDQN